MTKKALEAKLQAERDIREELRGTGRSYIYTSVKQLVLFSILSGGL